MFRRFDIDFTGSDTDSPDTFDALQTSINFEDIVRGRKGAILVDADKDGPSSLGLIPLVRSTTPYSMPAQRFRQTHYDLMDRIIQRSKLDMQYNNAMIGTAVFVKLVSIIRSSGVIW